MTDYVIGTLLHAKDCLDWQSGMGTGSSKFQNLVKTAMKFDKECAFLHANFPSGL